MRTALNHTQQYKKSRQRANHTMCINCSFDALAFIKNHNMNIFLYHLKFVAGVLKNNNNYCQRNS